MGNGYDLERRGKDILLGGKHGDKNDFNREIEFGWSIVHGWCVKHIILYDIETKTKSSKHLNSREGENNYVGIWISFNSVSHANTCFRQSSQISTCLLTNWKKKMGLNVYKIGLWKDWPPLNRLLFCTFKDLQFYWVQTNIRRDEGMPYLECRKRFSNLKKTNEQNIRIILEKWFMWEIRMWTGWSLLSHKNGVIEKTK